jgi:hypothetical protein
LLKVSGFILDDLDSYGSLIRSDTTDDLAECTMTKLIDHLIAIAFGVEYSVTSSADIVTVSIVISIISERLG